MAKGFHSWVKSIICSRDHLGSVWKCSLISEKISLWFLWAGSDSKNTSICHLYPSGMDVSFYQGICSLSHVGVRPVQSSSFICRNAIRNSITLSTPHLSYFMACIVIFAQSNIALSHISYPCRSFTSTFPLPRHIFPS